MDPQKPPMPQVESTVKQETIPTGRIRPLYRSTQVVWYVVGLIEVFLLLRFLLKLLGANPAAGFSQFIYGVTWLFASPFIYLFHASTPVQGSIIEWSTIFAMLVYLLFGWLIVKALVMSKPVTTKEANENLPRQEKI